MLPAPRKISGSIGLALLIPALFVSFFGHVTAIVAYTITGTSGLPDDEQGLATGLATMSQQVGITMGIPVMSAIVAARLDALGPAAPEHMLSAVTTAIGVNAALSLLAAAIVGRGLREGAR